MKNILIFGAGKSSGALIDYLYQHAESDRYSLTVADVSAINLEEAIKNKPSLKTIKISNIEDDLVNEIIAQNTLIISMLPAALHFSIAQKCLTKKKNLITPSYISTDMQSLHEAAKNTGLLFLNEMGLDPGIDHLSACAMINQVQEKGGIIESFKSHCGGLVAKESNDNPWGYKFSWNPRNVVVAGQGSGFIRWKENGRTQHLPYHRLFASAETITHGNEKFDTYPNRDSLVFIDPYHLQNAQTVYRGTLRYDGFCNAWNLLVQLGLCDEHTLIDIDKNETNVSFLMKFVQNSSLKNIEAQTARVLNENTESEAFKKLKWLGFFEEKKLPVSGTQTAALVVQKILEGKWQLKKGDKDRIVMIHEMVYRLNENRYSEQAILDKNGDESHTAMAATVGLPIGIAARMILKNEIQLTGVLRPVMKEIYESILVALANLGIAFKHIQKEL